MANLKIQVLAATSVVNQIISKGSGYGFSESGLYRSTYAAASQLIWGDFNGVQFFINKTYPEIESSSDGDSMNDFKIRLFLDDTNKMLPKKVRILYSPTLSQTSPNQNYAKSQNTIVGKGGMMVSGSKSISSAELGSITDFLLPDTITDGFVLDGFHAFVFYMTTNGNQSAANSLEFSIQILDASDNIIQTSQYGTGGVLSPNNIKINASMDLYKSEIN